MKAADDDRNVRCPKLAREVECAGKLIGLDTDQSHKAGARCADRLDDLVDPDDGVALVDRLNLDVYIRAEHLRGLAVGEETVNAREAVGRNERPPPLDHVAIVVIMRRLDQDRLEGLDWHHAPRAGTPWNAKTSVLQGRARH